MAQRLVLKLTGGEDAPERLAQAFTVAAVAVASRRPHLALAHRRGFLAVTARRAESFELPHSAPLAACGTASFPGGC